MRGVKGIMIGEREVGHEGGYIRCDDREGVV